MAYQIWYLGGYLFPGVERERYQKFGMTLWEVFNTLVKVNDNFAKAYEFKWEERCTKKLFLQNWTNPTTAAIIFHSHGDTLDPRPVPLAYHYALEDPKNKLRAGVIPVGSLEPDGTSPLRLDPQKLPASSASLRGLAILACDSGASKEVNDDWAEKIPQDAAAVGSRVLLEGGDDWSSKATGINRWIWSASREQVDFLWAHDEPKKYHTYATRETCFSFNKNPLKTEQKDCARSAWDFFKYLAYKGPAGNLQDKRCGVTPSNRAGGRHVLATAQAWVPGPTVRKSGPLGSA
jgi:hypothetical protein